MLFELLNRVVGRISALDPERAAPEMAAELRRHFPETFDLQARGIPAEVSRLIALGVAQAALDRIREIPDGVTELRTILERPDTDPAVAAVLVSILAYLVQPHDLIPDDAPGGFGFVDDYVMLCAGRLDFVGAQRGRESEMSALEKNLGMMASLVPPPVKPELQAAVDGLSLLVQLMRAVPPDIQRFTIQAMVANPLMDARPVAPTGFVPHAGVPVGNMFPQSTWEGRHTWRSGDTIGVSFPGGGGVISNGRNIVAT